MAMKELLENSQEGNQKNPIDIKDLVTRLQDLCPQQMAKALYTLEFHKKLNTTFRTHIHWSNQFPTDLYFSRGMKQEIQTIYLELARHLKAKNQGATDLMNQVFDFFTETVKSLVKVPFLVSNN